MRQSYVQQATIRWNHSNQLRYMYTCSCEYVTCRFSRLFFFVLNQQENYPAMRSRIDEAFYGHVRYRRSDRKGMYGTNVSVRSIRSSVYRVRVFPSRCQRLLSLVIPWQLVSSSSRRFVSPPLLMHPLSLAVQDRFLPSANRADAANSVVISPGSVTAPESATKHRLKKKNWKSIGDSTLELEEL